MTETEPRAQGGVPQMAANVVADDRRPVVLVHTPKCAGKALRESLKTAYGEALYLRYSNPLKLDGVRRTAQRIRGETVNRAELRTCGCVFGHFSLAGYRRAVRFGDVRTGMFFREPLDLLVSYYFYHHGKRRGDGGSLDEHAGGLLHLAGQPYMRSFYRRFLGGLTPRQLDYVGLFEHLDRSLELYGQVFGVRLIPSRTNVTRARPRDARLYLHEAGLASTIDDLMAENHACYREACERFTTLCEGVEIPEL